MIGSRPAQHHGGNCTMPPTVPQRIAAMTLNETAANASPDQKQRFGLNTDSGAGQFEWLKSQLLARGACPRHLATLPDVRALKIYGIRAGLLRGAKRMVVKRKIRPVARPSQHVLPPPATLKAADQTTKPTRRPSLGHLDQNQEELKPAYDQTQVFNRESYTVRHHKRKLSIDHQADDAMRDARRLEMIQLRRRASSCRDMMQQRQGGGNVVPTCKQTRCEFEARLDAAMSSCPNIFRFQIGQV